jgi:putative RNA 2'-phosphotransferase
MTSKEKTKASKFMSLILRHNPAAGGIVLDANGWANTFDLVKALRTKFPAMSVAILKEIVAEDEKQRYALSAHDMKIRANQGHSIDVDVELIETIPPDVLFHGTSENVIWMIERDGILPMDRQYVHLSENWDTAIKVGKRHGKPRVIVVQSGKMANHVFYRSQNGVWLTKEVPVNYLIFEDPFLAGMRDHDGDAE